MFKKEMVGNLEKFCQNTRLTKKNGGLNVQDMKSLLGETRKQTRSELTEQIIEKYCSKDSINVPPLFHRTADIDERIQKVCKNPSLTKSRGGLNLSQMRHIVGVKTGNRSDIVKELAKHCKKKNHQKNECVEQTTKKYTSRKSPPYPANQCIESDIKVGNDGENYIVSKPDKRGVKRWKKLNR